MLISLLLSEFPLMFCFFRFCLKSGNETVNECIRFFSKFKICQIRQINSDGLSVCEQVCVCMCVLVCECVCRGILKSMHRASQITSVKLAILNCNCFIKSTMNWYPEVSKESFYCILQIISKFTQLAANSQIWLHLIYLKLIYGKLPHIKFLSHITYIIPLPEVQSMSGPFDGFFTCVERNKELVAMMSSRIMMSLLWCQSLWSPGWSLFPP